MSNLLKFSLSFFLLTVLYYPAKAAGFANPVLKTMNADCTVDNLRAERFASEVSPNERVKLCQAIEKITYKLNATAWSPAVSAELQNIWRIFSTETVTLRLMPKGTPSRMLAMAEAFPSRGSSSKFEACVYVRPEKSEKDSFFQVLLHELRHVLDFHDTWKNKTALNSLEIERRAFLLVSKLTQETPEKENFSGIPKFWKESWRNRSAEEISAKRDAAIQKYLRGNKFYRTFAHDPNKQALDFSYLKAAAQSDNRQFTGNKKDGERLPFHQSLPGTRNVLPQNIQELSFKLEKPKNPRDPKEILRVALRNEKKFYYGMSNFVYDQKLAFQCWRKGKVSATFTENNTVARTDSGDALFELNSATTMPPCILNYQDLKTDFTDTFWASPALEKMPIYFVGFYEIEGKILAQYDVLQPDAKLFAQLANEYPSIRPFRVMVGVIYISPEDGQIVRFGGSSFPEDSVTGTNSRKVWGSYWVTAVRQKLNIDNGLWVTVHVGTVAVANVKGNFQPFSYTVKFENYRQSTTDVQILDDVAATGNGSSWSSGK